MNNAQSRARVRVFIASSLDGFIAGLDDDLSWLPAPDPAGSDHGYAAFMAQVGALLMGRRTFDVVQGLGVAWPYGDRPVLVATHRPLPGARPGVRPVSGTIDQLLDLAVQEAGGRDVYLDGGDLIRAALDVGRIDELVVTLIPAVLGAGVPLFAGARQRHALQLLGAEPLPGGLVQLTLAPRPRAAQGGGGKD